MISSGVGNMTLGPNRYTLFSDGWLSMKLMVFAAMVLAGIYFGIQGARRTRIAVRLADGSSSEHDHPALKALDTQQVTAFLTQLVLMIGILWLSIVRPHA